VEDEGPAIEKGPRRVAAADRPASKEDVNRIDVAGAEDPELNELAQQLLNTRGAFRGEEGVSGDWAEYRATLQVRVQERPSAFAYWLLAGVCNSIAPGSSEALAAAKQAVALAPQSAWAYDLLGAVLAAAGQDAEAAEAFSRALQLARSGSQPPNAQAWGGGQDEDVMRGGQDEDVTRGGQDEDVLRALADAGLQAFANVRYADLLPAPALLTERVDSAAALSALQLPGTEDAELAELARELVALPGYVLPPVEPKSPKWRQLMGKLKKKLGQGASALASWMGAGALLADAQWGSSEVSGALAAALKAAELAPDSAPAHYMLGIARYFSKDVNQAVEELKRALKLDADFAAPHFVLADIFARQGQPAKAKAELQAILKLAKPGGAEYRAAEEKLKLLEPAG